MTKQFTAYGVCTALILALFFTNTAGVSAHLIHDNYQQQSITYEPNFETTQPSNTTNWVVGVLVASIILISITIGVVVFFIYKNKRTEKRDNSQSDSQAK